MFLHLSVILFTGGCAFVSRGSASLSILSRCAILSKGVPSLAGGFSEESAVKVGAMKGGYHEGPPPPIDEQVGGTHPTGMHSL